MMEKILVLGGENMLRSGLKFLLVVLVLGGGVIVGALSLLDTKNPVAVDSLFPDGDAIAQQARRSIQNFCAHEFKFDPLNYKVENNEALNSLKFKLEKYRGTNGKISNNSLRIALRKVSYKIDQKIQTLLKENCLIKPQADIAVRVSSLYNEKKNIEGNIDLRVGDTILSLNDIPVNVISYSAILESLAGQTVNMTLLRQGKEISQEFSCPSSGDCILGFAYNFSIDNTMFTLDPKTGTLVHTLWLVKVTIDNLT